MLIIGFVFVVPLICQLFVDRDKVLSLRHLYLTLCLVHPKLLENVGRSKSNRTVIRSHRVVFHFVDS